MATDPATTPHGNEVLFMVPVTAMQEAQSWDQLATGTLAEFGIDTIDHVDISYNGGTLAWRNPTTTSAWCSSTMRRSRRR